MTFAKLLDAHVYIVHMSCEEALREAVAGKLRGVKVWVETLIQYLRHSTRPTPSGRTSRAPST